MDRLGRKIRKNLLKDLKNKGLEKTPSESVFMLQLIKEFEAEDKRMLAFLIGGISAILIMAGVILSL